MVAEKHLLKSIAEMERALAKVLNNVSKRKDVTPKQLEKRRT